MSFAGLPVSQEPLLEQPVYRNNQRSRVKISVIFIIILTAFFLILMVSLTILFEKKIQGTPSHTSTMISTSTGSTTTPTTIRSSSVKATTTSVVSINNTTALFPDDGSKPSGCQLPLIPTYNTDKTIVAGSELQGSSVYELNKPIAIALDSKRNLFVADAGNFRVLKYIPNSTKGEIVLGHGTDRSPEVSNIIGLLIDKNDLLYTYQYNASLQGEIIIWPSSSKNGTVIMTNFGHVAGFTIDRDLNIYLAWTVNIWIWLAPTYKKFIFKRVFGELHIDGWLPIGASSIYVDANSNLFAIDTENHRIQKTPTDDQYSETILQGSPTLLAIVGDCHNNLYTVDSNSSLIIYNSAGDVISTMHNAIDNPYYSDSWKHTYMVKKTVYIPDNFASLVLDSKTGDLYVIMYGYDRVTKFTLN